mmetsp:Transcript_27630/g.76049  ORF Transcript_27630/g.76049 Transcript_27630/m.76049 type:complete len:149 (+) Transcript_27630:162-608(+)|eukprot:CAMPEP_0168730338 /NCGR_PEP_ID=MMETSP0724-20121128/6679_1 /TAXON_ID=265536 /ORGANISM="Amphiprora sp., Strain CCMP467" /LENGTH=148 /DNA_ID=CAMNT_0008777273 /DNA_START=88 /DNA_END=534 /DNA_ORIENTATION=-
MKAPSIDRASGGGGVGSAPFLSVDLIKCQQRSLEYQTTTAASCGASSDGQTTTTRIFPSNFVGSALFVGKSIVDHASSSDEDDGTSSTASQASSLSGVVPPLKTLLDEAVKKPPSAGTPQHNNHNATESSSCCANLFSDEAAAVGGTQ